MSNVGPLAPPVVPGYEYEIHIEVTGPDVVFPLGVELRAQVRPRESSEILLAELTTVNGGLARVDDNTVAIRIPSEATSNIPGSSIMFDLVRDDGADEVYLYLQMKLYVMAPVTRPR